MLLAFIVAFALDAEWWGKLLVVGVVVYYGYKVFSAPRIGRSSARSMTGALSSTAHYAFYEEGFRVSGIQSASVFPYFQIVDLRRHSTISICTMARKTPTWWTSSLSPGRV